MDLFEEIIKSVLLKEDASIDNINDAINNTYPVEIHYWSKGVPVATGRRFIYPVAYGLTKAGNPVVRAFEPYGDTTTKVPAWKFFRVDRIRKWRSIKNKTFKGKKLEGFNKSGDMTMSVVYNIANIDGRPNKINDLIPIGNTPITKNDIQTSPDVKTKLEPNKVYNSQEVIDDILGGIKAQVDNPNKEMVDDKTIDQINKDNARRQLRIAKKKGITLDNEQELIDIINGNVPTKPITKNDIGNTGINTSDNDKMFADSEPVYKDDIEQKAYDLAQKWGAKYKNKNNKQ